MLLSWTPVTPVAGQGATFTAFGFDQFGAPMGNVTPGTTFTITPDGSCVANVCTATIAGAHRVTATRGPVLASAIYSVMPGSLHHLGLAPAASTIPVGGSQAYTAQGFDAFGNSLGSRTATTTFTITPDGSCVAATCSASIVGPHVVTGTDGSATGTATLAVVAGTLDSIVINPSEATIDAGDTQTYTAAGFDAGGNPLGDVTAGTVFTIEGTVPTTQGTGCTLNECGSTVAGDYTITGTNGTLTDVASLSVVAGDPGSIEITPDSSTGTAGEPQTFTVEAFDAFGNSTGDVTEAATFSIDMVEAEATADEGEGASCTGNVCTAYQTGDYVITVTYLDIQGTASLTIQPAGLDAIEIAPSEATIDVGQTQAYTATGYDEFGNLIGNVTGDTTFGIEPVAGEAGVADTGCTANVCGSTVAGEFLVTGTNGTASDIATLIVEAGDVASIVIAPSTATITAGGAQAYTAMGFDPFGNPLGNVTGDTEFSMDGSGSCTGASCGSDYAGVYTVTGTLGTATDTATLTVEPGDIDYLTIDPESAEIDSGGSQAYTTDAYDAFGNLIGDVTGDTAFSITMNGNFEAAAGEATCTANVCTAFVATDYTVTGEYLGEYASSLLTVTAGELDSIVIWPSEAEIPAGTTQAYSAEGYDAAGNWLGDVTPGTTFTISGSGTCSGVNCGSETAGTYTVTGTNGTATDTGTLTVTPGAAATLILAPATASIQTTQTQAYTATAFDAYDNPLGTVTGATSFSISGSGTCSANACGSTTAGSYTVTGTYGAAVGTAVLTVTTPPVDGRIIKLRLTPGIASIPLGSEQSYVAEGLDAHDNVIADVTASTVFSIVPDGSCSNNTCTPGRVGEHTVHGAYGNKNATAKLIAFVPDGPETTNETPATESPDGKAGIEPPAAPSWTPPVQQINPQLPPAPRPVPGGDAITPPVLPRPQPSGGIFTPPVPQSVVPPVKPPVKPAPKPENEGVLGSGWMAEPVSSRKRITETQPVRLQDCPVAPAGGLMAPGCDDDAK